MVPQINQYNRPPLTNLVVSWCNEVSYRLEVFEQVSG